MAEVWKLRVYENGKHMHISNYSKSALNSLATATIGMLERKDIKIRIDSDGTDILLEYPEPLPRSLLGVLVRIYPPNRIQTQLPDYVHLHFIQPSLYSKYYQRPLNQILMT